MTNAKPPLVDEARRSSPNLLLPIISCLIILICIGGILVVHNSRGPRRDTIEYSFFLDQIENRNQITDEVFEPNVLFVEIDDREVHGVFVEPPAAPAVVDREGNLERPYKEYLAKHFRVVIPPSDQVKAELIRLLHNRGIRFTAMEHDHTLTIVYFLLAMLPVTFVLSMWFSFRRARTLTNENFERSSDVDAP